ncbi:MAG: polysaccharide deacetylase family protein [Calditrichaeota bacterium]|nr:polysaccharide deacetylase family protein [Calditrichota bacterium]
MTDTCKNHPDREAKRKCYYCKAPICADCQRNIAHHIYCSKKCFFKDIFSRSMFFVVNRLKIFWQHVVTNYKTLRARPANLVLVSVLLLGLLSSIWLNISNSGKVNHLQKQMADLQEKIAVADSLTSVQQIARHLDTLKVTKPTMPSMVIRNKITIEGETEDNRVVTISADGNLLAAKLVKANKFTFENIEVKPGRNRFTVRALSEDGSSILLEEVNFKYAPPTPSFLARDFTRGSINKKEIALTFDGDYLDNITDEILDVLKEEHVHATMFLTGRYIRRYGKHVLRMLEDGHDIGNHSWTHPHLTTFEINRKHDTRSGVTRELVQQQLLKTAELFRRFTGRRMKPFWRAPYGEHNAEIRRWAAEVGFRQIGWTVGRDWQNNMDTLDWVADTTATIYHSAEEIVDKILSFGENSPHGANGCIILMHLGTLRKGDYPHEKLPTIIREMKNRGYQFVTISELLTN